jgi:hypothetical protein
MELKDLDLVNLLEIATNRYNPIETRYLAWKVIPDKSLISIRYLVRIGMSGEHERLTKETHDELLLRPELTADQVLLYIQSNKISEVVSSIWNDKKWRKSTKIEDLVEIIQRDIWPYGITQKIIDEAYELAKIHPDLSEKHLCNIAFCEDVAEYIRLDAEKILIKLPNLSSSTLANFCLNGLSEKVSSNAWFMFESNVGVSYYELQNIAHNSPFSRIKQLATEELNTDYFKLVSSLML